MNVEELLAKYKGKVESGENDPTKNLRFLIYGGSGTGKTYSLRTAKKPIFVDSFDPEGAVALQDLAKQGLAIIETSYEDEDAKKPTAFAAWDKNFDQLVQSKFFEKIGTYVLDSATTWAQAALNVILAKAGRTGGIPQQNDWYPQMVLIENSLRRIMQLPCDVVFICHDDVLKDEITGKVMRAPLLTGKAKKRIPLLFGEIFYAHTTRSSKGTEYKWLLSRDSTNEARSRMKGLTHQPVEDMVEQDFSKLMALWKREYKDLPKLW